MRGQERWYQCLLDAILYLSLGPWLISSQAPLLGTFSLKMADASTLPEYRCPVLLYSVHRNRGPQGLQPLPATTLLVTQLSLALRPNWGPCPVSSQCPRGVGTSPLAPYPTEGMGQPNEGWAGQLLAAWWWHQTLVEACWSAGNRVLWPVSDPCSGLWVPQQCLHTCFYMDAL
jgi:hypothetical protein